MTTILSKYLGKYWQALTIACASLLALLGVYLKGRSDGKVKGDMKLKDAELDTHKAIIKEKENHEKTDQMVNEGFDDVPDHFTK